MIYFGVKKTENDSQTGVQGSNGCELSRSALGVIAMGLARLAEKRKRRRSF